MNSAFESQNTTATSSDVERNFKIIKYHITNNQMTRADKFLRLHLNYLLSEMKLVQSSGTIYLISL